jgi:hypothetical protein
MLTPLKEERGKNEKNNADPFLGQQVRAGHASPSFGFPRKTPAYAMNEN